MSNRVIMGMLIRVYSIVNDHVALRPQNPYVVLKAYYMVCPAAPKTEVLLYNQSCPWVGLTRGFGREWVGNFLVNWLGRGSIRRLHHTWQWVELGR